MRYFSLFSGVGGFEMGIKNAYVDAGRHAGERGPDVGYVPDPQVIGTYAENPACVGFSEIDRYASAVLRYRFPNVRNYGDITRIDWAAVPDFDLLVGGSPCQSFSVAGKRAGFSGASGLYFEYLRALREKKPAHFIWENVKGVLSSNGGRDFARILDTMAEAGYSLWWQVLNARDFGVPQNRERVFVVGTRTDVGSPREIFFETGAGGKGAGEIPAKTLRAHAGGFSEYDTYVRCQLRFLSRNQKEIAGDHAFTVDAGQTAGVQAGSRVRRLMPIETERLMSWPDDWTRFGTREDGTTHEVSDTQRYKMCGNGVVSKVVEAVVKAHLV